MAAINSKYHVKIGNFGFLLARMARTDRHYYNRKEAPHFVNKFSSGEPNYRDSTFFPHWVQINFLNGFEQEFFDDGGKFYRSNGLDTTEALQLTLEKGFNSIGQTASGLKVTAQESLKISAGLADSYTKLLMSFDGADGATLMTDTSPIPKTITAVGNAQLDTAQKKFGTSSLLLDGTGDYLTLEDSDDWSFGSGEFTVDCWVRFNGTPPDGSAFVSTIDSVVGNQGWAFYRYTTSLYFSYYDGSSLIDVARTWSPVASTWYHVAVVRTGNTIRLFVDGTQLGADYDATGKTIQNPSTLLKIGRYYNESTTLDLNGWLDEVRISKGIARWTTTFTPESTAYTTPTASYTFKNVVGTSEGKIYSWDNLSTYTEIFDTRRLEWFETGTDANLVVGDTGGTETAQAQSFQVDAVCSMQGVQVYLKKAAGTPGDITVTIETNSTDKPSGTLVNANGTATVTAFTTSTYGWITVEFPVAFALAAATTYWIVLKTAAAGNDNNYNWAADSSSPGYTAGTSAVSTNGGSTWAAVTGTDNYFRVLASVTSVNCILNNSLSGTEKLYFGTGNQSTVVNGDARLYSYDGTDFVLVKIFSTTNESSINAMTTYGATTTKAYLALGHVAKIYTTTDWSTFTLAKTITVPSNPGWVLTMTEYNGKLYCGGGFPAQLPGTGYQYNGFLYSFDEFSWENIGYFQHTVVTALEVYDNLMFIGTIKRRLYVFNTASVDKLFEFPWNLKVSAMKKWDDKLAIATCPTPGNSATGGEGIYMFDRNGFHNAYAVTDRSWYSLSVLNNNLLAGNDGGYVYQTSFTTYQLTGYLQTSYDEAQLPSIDKVRRSVTLMFESLPADTSIAVSYKGDESDSAWTSLGTASTDGTTEETFNFAAGVYNKKISFKITLTTTTSTSTPTLKKIVHKYVLAPDFKYLWEMKLLCADNITWLDGEEPIAILATATTAGVTSITLKSSNDASPLGGFPDPSGSAMYCSIINPTTGVADRFTYTGLTTTTLTGIPATGANALGVNAAGSVVRITGGDLHQKILDLKEDKTLYTFTDIDGLTYTVLFHAFSEDNFVINQDDYWGGLENEVPITLLEA